MATTHGNLAVAFTGWLLIVLGIGIVAWRIAWRWLPESARAFLQHDDPEIARDLRFRMTAFAIGALIIGPIMLASTR